jgi:lipoprotein-releasing system permease protein
MYKLLLCWRYLKTRYIALASIISVMLGVATLIAVNAVMKGFAHETQDRLHGFLSDLVLETPSLEGIPNAELYMQRIRKVAGQYIAGMSPTVVVPAMLGYNDHAGRYITQQIMLIGVDEATYASVSDFGGFLQHPENRKQLDFKLKAGGYDVYDHTLAASPKRKPRKQMQYAGWAHRRRKALYAPKVVAPEDALDGNPFYRPGQSNFTDEIASPQGTVFDPASEQHTGCVLGISLCRFHTINNEEGFRLLPGDDVEITYVTAGRPPKPLSAKFTVVDFYESKMGEYDSQFVFVPIGELQKLRGMIDPLTNVANFSRIQIRVKPGVDLDMVRDLLRAHFQPHENCFVGSWLDRESPLLAMIRVETGILNVLLFLIIAVAGFGILAIFFMIVVEKTRDIGILKSLGASRRGIMSIFLGYGFSLGIVGASMGLGLGLLIVRYISEIADGLGRLTGQPFFDPTVYGLPKIPAIIQWPTIATIIVGALLIAVLASILPARRAARLHPVEALRYE